MAACGSIHHIFDNPLPENPSSLIQSLSSSSWNQIKSPVIDHHSFTELFGELHFKENSDPTTSFKKFPDNVGRPFYPFSSNGYLGSGVSGSGYHHRSESFSSMNSESLQLCTEGLGFESMDNLEDLKMKFQNNYNGCHDEEGISSINHSNDNDNNMVINSRENHDDEKVSVKEELNYDKYYNRKGRYSERVFPPPISCIGRTGKPWVCFQSQRENGRFILKEIRMPSHEILQACRQDGRLRLCFVNEEEDGDEEDDEDEDEDEGKDCVIEKVEKDEVFERGNS